MFLKNVKNSFDTNEEILSSFARNNDPDEWVVIKISPKLFVSVLIGSTFTDKEIMSDQKFGEYQKSLY